MKADKSNENGRLPALRCSDWLGGLHLCVLRHLRNLTCSVKSCMTASTLARNTAITRKPKLMYRSHEPSTLTQMYGSTNQGSNGAGSINGRRVHKYRKNLLSLRSLLIAHFALFGAVGFLDRHFAILSVILLIIWNAALVLAICFYSRALPNAPGQTRPAQITW